IGRRPPDDIPRARQLSGRAWRHTDVERRHPLLAGAGHRANGEVVEPKAAQYVVDRVGDHEVVSDTVSHLGRQPADALWLGKLGDVRASVGQPAVAGADPSSYGLEIGFE